MPPHANTSFSGSSSCTSAHQIQDRPCSLAQPAAKGAVYYPQAPDTRKLVLASHGIASHESNASKHPRLPRFVTHRKLSKLQAHRLALPRKHPYEPVHTIRRKPRRGEPSFASTSTPSSSLFVSLTALQHTRARHCGPRCMTSFWILQQS
jgi:hypothetical protein